jgi:hypothetical protein
MNNDEMKQLLLENKASLERIDKVVEKIHKRMIWSTIGSILKIILIVAPIVLGVIYLSPMLKQYMGGLDSALKILNPTSGLDVGNANGGTDASGFSLEEVCSPNVQQMIDQMCK